MAHPSDRYADILFLVLAIGVLLLSIIFTPGEARVNVLGVEIPEVCMFKRFTGWDCFGCGLTRSFTWMGQGAWRQAFDQHMLGPFAFVFVGVQIPYRAYLLWKGSGPLTSQPDQVG